MPPAGQPTGSGKAALLFVPGNPSPALRAGEAITLPVALTGEPFIGSITSLQPGVITPEEARERFALAGNRALVITQPSVVVQVTVEPGLPVDVLPGSVVSAQVLVGSTSLLSLFPRQLSGVSGG